MPGRSVLLSVALIFVLALQLLLVPIALVTGSDVATPAARASPSEEYSPHTAWELGYTGKGVNVAIMDTGIDNGHPSFAGKFLGGADFSKPETPLTPRDGSFDPDDTNGHGTTCAGIATGTGAPSGTYPGIATAAKLVDLRIGTTFGFSPGEGPVESYDAALQATEWAIEHKDQQWGGDSAYDGIDIISLSWGIPYEGSSDGSDRYSQLLDRASDAGIVCVVAAGNDGPDNSGITGMGAASKVITVGATDDKNTVDRSDDIIAYYSSRGPRDDNGDGNPFDELKPEISAPGTNIMQAVYSRTGDGSDSGYGNRGSGTSYATPLVAGVCALMLEANPALTPEQVRAVLTATAERRGEPTYPDLDPFWNRDFGYGMVDAYNATRLAALLVDDLGGLDTALQCSIAGITPGERAVTISGMAWSRAAMANGGSGNDSSGIDGLEYRVDNGTWQPLTMSAISDGEGGNDGVGNVSAAFGAWEARLENRKIGVGNHTVAVRAVSGGSVSLPATFEVQITSAPTAVTPADPGVFSAVAVALGVVVAIGAVAYYFDWRRRSQ